MTQFRGEKLGTFGQDEDKVWELNIEDYNSRMSGMVVFCETWCNFKWR